MRSIHQPSLRDLSHAHVVPGVETPYLFSVTARGTPRHAAAPERGSMSRSNVRKPRAPDNSEASGAATLLRVTDPRSGAVALSRNKARKSLVINLSVLFLIFGHPSAARVVANHVRNAGLFSHVPSGRRAG